MHLSINCEVHFDAISSTPSTSAHSQGFRGLYKGVPAPLVGVTPLFALSFYGYGLGKQLQMATPTQELRWAGTGTCMGSDAATT